MNIQERLKYALHKPITPYRVFDSFDRKYLQDERKFGLNLSTLLTVEGRESRFQWHFSITVLGPDGTPVPPRGYVSDVQAEDIADYMADMLDSVGDGVCKLLPTEGGFHMYKNLTAGELLITAKHAMAAGN